MTLAAGAGPTGLLVADKPTGLFDMYDVLGLKDK